MLSNNKVNKINIFKKWFLFVLAISITLFSLSFGVNATDNAYSAIKDRLNLTDEQAEKFKPIILYQWEKRLAVMKKHGINRDSSLSEKKIGLRQLRAVKKEMDKINKEIEKQLANILSKEQMDEYNNIQEENRVEMRMRLREKK
jgi:hypothetical protein|tara:strand:+ start:1284 stop:1715 length:432 start_codon:yes stop_codon:yes gene_type:complete